MWQTGLLLLLLLSYLLPVIGSNHIVFSGFTEGTVYTYYTNGANPIAELTCIATPTDNTVSAISTSWYQKTGSSGITDTGSSVLRFEDVATVVKWRESRVYFCRAVYNINGEEQQEDSENIVVAIEYNTTIAVSYSSTTHVRDITNTNSVLIPVMTESVAISCDAEGGEWYYYGQTGTTHTGVSNPLTIDLFTIEYAIHFYCRKRWSSTSVFRTVHSVTLYAVGSGIWLQQEDTYTELSEAETIVLTEDRTPVCVSSSGSAYTSWYYRGDSNTGVGERITDTELDSTKGFLKLNFPITLPSNRTGFYYCTSYENIDTRNTQLKDHSIRISLTTGSNHIAFSGFTDGTVYTYYTNGANPIAELTCIATPTDNTVSAISTSWYYRTASTGSSVLSFEDVATVVKWKQSRTYFCRAVYNINGQEQQEDSENIVVAIEYNTTITVSYSSTTHVRDITNTNSVLIPVMTDNVAISCDAEEGKWSYYIGQTGTAHTGASNPVNIDLFTKEYALTFDCKKRESSYSGLRTVHSVTVVAVGSGIWLQQEDTYTELSEAGTVVLTEDTTLVCVTSTGSAYTSWYYRGDSNTDTGERITDTVSDTTKGFLKLNFPKSLPSNRTGFYYCTSNENIDTYNTLFKEHSIRISLPTDSTTASVTTAISTTEKLTPTTTAVPTYLPISIQLHYTPEYSVVFAGVDDVTVFCVVSTDSRISINVSLVDTETGSILKSHTGSEGEIRLEQRVELRRGEISYRCTADTETGGTEEQTVVLRVEDPYTQEIVNLHTEISPDGREVLVEWDTTHPLLANETFIVWLQSVNVSSGYQERGRTDGTEYSLLGLSDSYHYSIRIQVVSRLNSSYSSLYYVHTEGKSQQISYVVIGLVMALTFVLLLIIVVVIVLLALLAFRRRNRNNAYTKQTGDNVPPETGLKSKEYIPLSGIVTPHTVVPKNSPGYKYEPMASVAPGHKDYYPLEIEQSRHYYEIANEDNIPRNVSPDKPEIPISKLKQHMDTLWRNGMQGLGMEFDELHLNIMRDTQQQGKLAINSHFNVDTAILPYDTSRVVLQGGKENDYVNASLIPGHVTDLNFISTQFPTDTTELRFWRMVWEQRISCVVIAATRDEMIGVRAHWPVQDSPRVLGALRVKLISVEDRGRCVVCRRIEISLCKRSSQTREVLLIEYSGWPVNEHSMLTVGLLESVSLARDTVRNKKDAPICVVCNTGCGRSGCLIAVYNLLDSIKEGRDHVSVFNCVNAMREHRPYMVDTLNQYRIVYTALLEIIHGNTSVNLNEVTLRDNEIGAEFQELEYQCVKAFHRPCLVAMQYDTSGLPLPYDDTRVFIETPATSHLSYAYYNASYIRSVGPHATNQFITAVSPIENNVCQFLEIVYQQKCSLVIAVGDRNANRYWEVEDSRIYDCLHLSRLSSNPKKGLLISELKLKRISTNKPHIFTHILYDTSEEEVLSGIYRSLLALLDTMLDHKRNPILVHCGDGVGTTGVILGAYYAVNTKTQEKVNIFQACKHLRIHKQDMVQTQDQYHLCYNAVRQYLQARLAQNYENMASVS